MSGIDISKVSKLTGIPSSTLRYYEKKELIKSFGRKGLKRVFERRVLEHLNFISLGQRAGFSLEDIKLMFSSDGLFRVNQEKLREKAADIGHEIERLEAIKRSLENAAECPNKCNCDHFQRLLRVAGKDETRMRKKSQTAGF